jgi:hypothetical protein
MADHVMFIGWGHPVRGAEERALEVFNETMGLYGRLQQEGRIEGFDVMLFDPNREMDGCIHVHGSAEQIAALRVDEEFHRSMVDAALIVEDLRLLEGYANEGVARQMALYQEAVAGVPQRA